MEAGMPVRQELNPVAGGRHGALISGDLWGRESLAEPAEVVIPTQRDTSL